MKIEIRADNTALITGYVNVVARESRVLRDVNGNFVELVEAGVFNRALEKATSVGLMFNHNRLLGSTADNSVELYEDNIGLYARAVVSDEEIIKKAKNNELVGWSFSFYLNEDEWSQRSDGMRLRTLKDIDLVEVSMLDITPAYIATSIEMRDGQNTLKEYRNAVETVELVDNSVTAPPAESDVDMSMLRRKFDFLII